MGTPTLNYGWLKPTIGGDATTWGNELNADLDGIDATVFSVAGTANAALPKTGGAMTGALTLRAGAAAAASAPAYFQASALLANPEAHALEWDGVHAFLTQAQGPTRRQLAYIDDAISGSAAKLSTARSIAMSGDVAWSVSFDGSANVAASGTIQNGAVTGAKIAAATVANSNLANMAAHTYKGNNSAAAAAPADVTVAQLLADLGFTTSGIAGGSIVLPGGLLIQWGDLGAQNPGATGTLTFPVAFPNACLAIVVKEVTTAGNTAAVHFTSSPGKTSVTWQLSGNASTLNNFWIAIGN